MKIDEEKLKEEIEKAPEIDDDFAGMIRDGVEVVDVKFIPKDKGIPTKSRKTWDKID